MKTSNTKSELIALSVVACLLLVAYIGGFIYIKSMQKETATLLAETIQQKSVQNQQLSLKTLAKNTKPDLDTLSGFVLPTGGDIAFIKNLESLAQAQSVTFHIVSADESPAGLFKNLSFQVTIDGAWSDVLHTIDIIESLPYKVSINQVSLNLRDDTGPASSGSKLVVHHWEGTMSFSVLEQK